MTETIKRPSIRAAINAMCKACLYDPGAGGSCLQQIIECSAVDCPLYPVRRKRSQRSAEDEPTDPVGAAA